MRLIEGISGRLLILTILVVMLVEVAIFVPSVARFRLDYLEERIVRAEIAALTVMAAPDGFVAPELEMKLLRNSGTLNVAVESGGVRILALPGEPLETMAVTYDLRDAGAVTLIHDALACLFSPKDDTVLRVVGETGRGIYDRVEITLPAAPLRDAMLDYGLRILQLSLVISIVTAVCVFLVVRRFVVAPLLGVIGSIKAFRENPEDASRVIEPKSRLGEVAEAERALADMQKEVRAALRERARLASLGEAVAKISHDLRNMLAAGQLMVDRLEMSRDPMVARTLPKLVGSLDRAIALCQHTLDFGRAEERSPDRETIALAALLDEVAAATGLPEPGVVELERNIPPGFVLEADPEHLYRVLGNLLRNAAEAIRISGQSGRIRVSAWAEAEATMLEIADTGPGMPRQALDNLFQPFRGGARKGGTGLGLAIAAELVEAHGGSLRLVSTGPDGTRFELRLPGREGMA